MTDQTPWPLWLADIRTTLSATPQYVLWGNVHDVHLVPQGSGFRTLSTSAAIYQVLEEAGIDMLLAFDPVDGLSVIPDDEQRRTDAQVLLGDLKLSFQPGQPSQVSVAELRRLLRLVASTTAVRTGLVISRPARLSPEPTHPDGDVHNLFIAAERAANTARATPSELSNRRVPNPIFWLLDREQDLPHWVVADNPGAIRAVVVGDPDRDTRRRFAQDFVAQRGIADSADSATVGSAIDDLADRCSGMSLSEIQRVIRIAEDQAIPLADMETAIRAYRVGAVDNPWRKDYLRQRVLEAEGPNGIHTRVRGQAAAITQTLDVLKRTVLGMSGAQAASSGRRPRGVLLLVGPTGTGKTELAKALTELVFGEGATPVRFDMSEFSEEHSEARFIGSPPGYVGNDAGGELTNAVRRNPFSLILFDEIDKANPRILDKFLQILDEGRLTDGRGATVSFQETLLVFTSNAGMVEVNAEIDERGGGVDSLPPYPELQQRLERALEIHFTSKLQRPELLNRFGENIVVFDFIRPPVTRQIFDTLVGHVERRVLDENRITVRLSDQAREDLAAACQANPVMGGRGIANLVEALYVNPLSRALFDEGVAPGETVHVTRWTNDGGLAAVDLMRP